MRGRISAGGPASCAEGGVLVVETTCGWLVWRDGCPARLLLTETPPPAPQQLLESVPGAEQPGGAPARRLRLVLVTDRRQLVLPPPALVLAKVTDGGWDRVEVAFDGHDLPEGFRHIRAWGIEFEQRVRSARPELGLSYELPAAVSGAGDEFWDFTLPRLGCVTIAAIDPGRDDAESAALAERAAEIADAGVRVRPTLCLTRRNVSHWDDWAGAWLGISRGAGMHFSRPVIVDGDCQRVLESLPSPEAVADFLASVYASEKYDLWVTRPFSTLLEAIFFGSAWVSRCGAEGLLALTGNGDELACPHGPRGIGGVAAPCSCPWGCLCDVVCAPCTVLSARASTGAWRAWERLFCPALQVILPSVFEQLARAARLQQLLGSRPSDVRLRVAGTPGTLRIWSEKVLVAEDPHEGNNG